MCIDLGEKGVVEQEDGEAGPGKVPDRTNSGSPHDPQQAREHLNRGRMGLVALLLDVGFISAAGESHITSVIQPLQTEL